MKYCNNCEQMVEPTKHFSLAGLILGGFVLYIIYYALKKKKCPMCNSQHWGVKPAKKVAESEVEEAEPVSEKTTPTKKETK